MALQAALTIEANGQTLIVNFTRVASVGSGTIYSDAALTTSVTFPVVISSDTTYYADPRADAEPRYTVSVTQPDGTELWGKRHHFKWELTARTIAPLPTAKQLAANNSNNQAILNYLPTDYGMFAWSFDPAFASGNTVLPAAAGTLGGVRIKVPAGLITNVLSIVGTGGTSLTSGQNFWSLYQGGNLLAQSADQTTAWGSSGLKTAVLSTPQVVSAGFVDVVCWWNGSAAPQFTRGQNNSGSNINLATTAIRAFTTADTGKTTTAPSTLGAKTAAAPFYWVGLS